MWVPMPPAAEAALAGATVIANLSGSPITVAKSVDRHLLCASSSARYLAAYVYSAGGEGESSTDLSWDGQTMIYENGTLLASSERFPERRARLDHRCRPGHARPGAAAPGHLRRQPARPR
jgi:NAD+ synthase (glutamine-hydrolysing)